MATNVTDAKELIERYAISKATDPNNFSNESDNGYISTSRPSPSYPPELHMLCGVEYHSLSEKTNKLVLTANSEKKFTLHHYHPSHAGITKWTAKMIAEGDKTKVTNDFSEMIKAVESCVSSFRASTFISRGSKGQPIVSPWIDNERKSDEELLKFLKKTYVQIMLSKKP